jgi:hypothetical protein
MATVFTIFALLQTWEVQDDGKMNSAEAKNLTNATW